MAAVARPARGLRPCRSHRRGDPDGDPAPAGPYAWKNVVIKGGGFVSGIVMSPALPGLAFARTDVGGAYRYDPSTRRWVAITDWVGHNDSNLIGIESIAADPVDPNRVYLAAGRVPHGRQRAHPQLDRHGPDLDKNSIAAPMGGNADGRNMGERLAVDPNLPSTLYFGSRKTGLWKSTDFAQTWTQVAALSALDRRRATAMHGQGLRADVRAVRPAERLAGDRHPDDLRRRRRYQRARALPLDRRGRDLAAGRRQPPTGMMPHHAVLDGCGNLYFTYNNGSGPNNVGRARSGATPDDRGLDGRQPPVPGSGRLRRDRRRRGPSRDAASSPPSISGRPARSIAPPTAGRAGRRSWARRHSDDVAGAQWLYWHGTSLPAAGWMGDVEIDPFDSSHALFITGQGLWSSDDVTAADTGLATHWTFDDDGLEETVALDLASPPARSAASSERRRRHRGLQARRSRRLSR